MEMEKREQGRENRGVLPGRPPVRFARFPLPILLLTSALAGCRADIGPGTPGMASLVVTPVTPAGALAPTLVLEGVRVVVSHPGADTLRDFVVPMAVDQDSLVVRVPLLLPAEGDSLAVGLTYLGAASVALFTGQRSGFFLPGAATPLQIPLVYVGPGVATTTLQLLPSDTSVTVGSIVTYTVTAADGQGLPVPDVYVTWSVTDPSVAISALGILVAPLVPTQLQVTAVTPTGVRGTANLVVTP